jgi:hypothetical protein
MGSAKSKLPKPVISNDSEVNNSELGLDKNVFFFYLELVIYFLRIWKNIKIDESTHSYPLEEILVPENFKVENGVLGLERDIYLSIVKFLNSSIVRKV